MGKNHGTRKRSRRVESDISPLPPAILPCAYGQTAAHDNCQKYMKKLKVYSYITFQTFWSATSSDDSRWNIPYSFYSQGTSDILPSPALRPIGSGSTFYPQSLHSFGTSIRVSELYLFLDHISIPISLSVYIPEIQSHDTNKYYQQKLCCLSIISLLKIILLALGTHHGTPYSSTIWRCLLLHERATCIDTANSSKGKLHPASHGSTTVWPNIVALKSDDGWKISVATRHA
jgi:hypothetical protein